MSVNDAIKDMLYGHEHRWRVAEHELAQARSEVARLTAEVEAMRGAIDEVCSWKRTDVTVLLSNPPQNAALVNAQRVLGDALRARKVGG